MFDAPKTFAELQAGIESLQGMIPDTVNGFFQYIDTVSAPGALDPKIKELICIGIIAYHRSPNCIAFHVQKALTLGATRQEIVEAAAMAVLFGGGPSLGTLASEILPAIRQFEEELSADKGK